MREHGAYDVESRHTGRGAADLESSPTTTRVRDAAPAARASRRQTSDKDAFELRQEGGREGAASDAPLKRRQRELSWEQAAGAFEQTAAAESGIGRWCRRRRRGSHY